MELYNLQMIVRGLDSLADIEKEHPELGAQLLAFVKRVADCCELAYDRLSSALGDVRSLPAKPTSVDIRRVLDKLSDAPSSKWFKDVSGICDRLAVLAEQFGPQLKSQMIYAEGASVNENSSQWDAYQNISSLLYALGQHEATLKDDIRNIVAHMQAKLGVATSGNVEEARSYALEVQREISMINDQINMLCLKISGGSSGGDAEVLAVAERALRRPERVLMLNALFVFVAVALGAAVFQVLAVYQFVLVTGFAITAVVVLNALYLRSIDALSEESFLKLMQLALLKFFAPLTRRAGG